jgi:hypothetical protein
VVTREAVDTPATTGPEEPEEADEEDSGRPSERSVWRSSEAGVPALDWKVRPNRRIRTAR